MGNSAPTNGVSVAVNGHPGHLTVIASTVSMLRFDWGGVRIATAVLRLPGATAWRYDADAYLAAVTSGLGTPLITGVQTLTMWDPALGDAISRHAIRVEEEHLIDTLLDDLDGDPRHRPEHVRRG